ncbi:MAG: hypothetical protein P8Y54_01725 [Xanthomonadales bacterium]
MNQNELRQTVFDVAPMKNVVGIGRATAYQIHVQYGSVLAKPVRRGQFIAQPAANDGASRDSAAARFLFSALERLLRR